jgi:biopolymer transport protein ExbD
MAQGASPDSPPDAVTVHISANGVCQFLNESVPCAHLGEHLLKKHWAPNAHVHIALDRDAKYELVAATLTSLQGTGFKVGFVNSE